MNPDKNTVKVYHGGKGLEKNYRDPDFTPKGKWEFGPGIYATDNFWLADKYSGGPRTVYEIDIVIDPKQDIRNVYLDIDSMVDFVRNNCIKSKGVSVIKDLYSHAARTSKTGICAEVLMNLCINHEALKGKKIAALRNYLQGNGVSFLVDRFQFSSGANIVTIFNPDIIKSIKKADFELLKRQGLIDSSSLEPYIESFNKERMQKYVGNPAP